MPSVSQTSRLRHAAIAVDDDERRKLTGSQLQLRERRAEVCEYRKLRAAQHVPDARVQHADVEAVRAGTLVAVEGGCDSGRFGS